MVQSTDWVKFGAFDAKSSNLLYDMLQNICKIPMGLKYDANNRQHVFADSFNCVFFDAESMLGLQTWLACQGCSDDEPAFAEETKARILGPWTAKAFVKWCKQLGGAGLGECDSDAKSLESARKNNRGSLAGAAGKNSSGSGGNLKDCYKDVVDVKDTQPSEDKLSGSIESLHTNERRGSNNGQFSNSNLSSDGSNVPGGSDVNINGGGFDAETIAQYDHTESIEAFANRIKSQFSNSNASQASNSGMSIDSSLSIRSSYPDSREGFKVEQGSHHLSRSKSTSGVLSRTTNGGLAKSQGREQSASTGKETMLSSRAARYAKPPVKKARLLDYEW
jgi:hypothetical protein